MNKNTLIRRYSSIALALGLAMPLLSGHAFAVKPATKSKTVKKEATVTFDPAASVVKWEGKKVTGQHEGTIAIKKGEIVMSGRDLKSGEVEFDMSSIVNLDLKDAEYNAKLIKHLKSEDFFSVEKFPTATLKIKNSKSVEGFVGPTFEITADLTIRGKTNEIKFPAVIDTKDGKTTAKANVTFDRTKWDIKYNSGNFFKGLGDKMINDEVKLDVALSTQ